MSTVSNRIKQLRTQSGLSQDQIANLMKMSRVTYNQLESGKRDVKKTELERLAGIFETTVTDLISEPTRRKEISADHPLYKMMQTVLYVLSKCAGKPNVGKIVLNKLLYFADFNHYEKYRKSVTGDVYIKMPMGPIPKSIDGVLALMQQTGYIQPIEANFHGYKQMRYIPIIMPDLQTLTATEVQELDNVIAKYGDKNGKRLTEYSHEDMPYQATKDIGDEISYGLVHYRSPIYSVTEQVNEGD